MENIADTTGAFSADFDPVTAEMREAIVTVALVIMCGFLSAMGIVANVINIVVFVKHGFKDSINISLLGLTVADLACVITMFWSSMCVNPLLVAKELPFASMDIMHITGAWPHVLFTRITSVITTFITLERCLCVTLPLQVKNIITPFRTKVIIVSIFAAMMIMFSPFCYVNRLEWQYSLVLNKSRLSLVFTEHREIIDSVMFFIHSVFLSTFSLLSVFICTVILVLKISRSAKWRQATILSTAANKESNSLKHKRVVKMVSFISIIFIVCFSPGTIFFLIMACDKSFNYGGRYENSFVAVWCVGFVLETINSSTNILIYLKMNSKFRLTFVQMFCFSYKD